MKQSKNSSISTTKFPNKHSKDAKSVGQEQVTFDNAALQKRPRTTGPKVVSIDSLSLANVVKQKMFLLLTFIYKIWMMKLPS